MFAYISNFLYEFFYVNADPRIRDKFLMGSPVPIAMFVIVYLLMSKFLPGYFKKRGKICDIKYPLMVVDFYFASVSFYYLIKLVKYMVDSNFDFRCMPIDYSDRYETLKVIN